MAAKRTTRSTKPKRDLEAEIADRFIAALEKGTVPWHKPWTASGILPTSVASGKPYRGINTLILALTAMERGYSSPYWLTYRQAEERGGHVKRGEKGTTVIFWKRVEVGEPEPVDVGGTIEYRRKNVPIMRAFTVFNVEQTEDVKLSARFTDPLEEREPVAISDALQAVLDGYVDGPSVSFVAGDSAHYNPTTDAITFPKLEQFEDETGFANTALHELTHSTGHASRLDRFARNGEPRHFGSERYAKEELVAEIGANLIAAEAGIDLVFEQSAAYVASWLGALKDDKSLITKAAQQAQKAADRIVGRTFSDATVVEPNGEAA